MEKETETTKLYELGYHVVPTVAQAELEKTLRALSALVESNGGTVLGGEFPEIRDLEYSITHKTESGKKKFTNAYFGWMNFTSDAESAVSVQKALKSDESVLRFLVIKKKVDDTPETDMFTPKKREKKDEEVETDEEVADKAIDEMVKDEA
jgi:ribosomal protein S6